MYLHLRGDTDIFHHSNLDIPELDLGFARFQPLPGFKSNGDGRPFLQIGLDRLHTPNQCGNEEDPR